MTKEYESLAEEVQKLGGIFTAMSTTIPNKETYKIRDNYISVGNNITYEIGIKEGSNVNAVTDALDAYTRAKVDQSIREQKAAKGIIAIETQLRPEEVATVAQNGPVAGFGPPAVESLASESKTPEGLENPVPIEVVKFTLARRTDGKYDLALYQMYGNKVGDYPDLKYTAEQGPMWQMIGHLVGDKSFDAMPVEYDVSWLAEWTYGREYKKKDGSTGRYKDLTGLRQR